MRFQGFPEGFDRAAALVDAGTEALAVFGDGAIVKTAQGRGVSPLLALVDAETDAKTLRGAAVADRVIGKAAAMLLVYAGATAVYGAIMSEAGQYYLLAHGVTASYGKLVPRIANRSRDGMCPVEQAVLDENNPGAGIEKIRAELERMQRANRK